MSDRQIQLLMNLEETLNLDKEWSSNLEEHKKRYLKQLETTDKIKIIASIVDKIEKNKIKLDKISSDIIEILNHIGADINNYNDFDDIQMTYQETEVLDALIPKSLKTQKHVCLQKELKKQIDEIIRTRENTPNLTARNQVEDESHTPRSSRFKTATVYDQSTPQHNHHNHQNHHSNTNNQPTHSNLTDEQHLENIIQQNQDQDNNLDLKNHSLGSRKFNTNSLNKQITNKIIDKIPTTKTKQNGQSLEEIHKAINYIQSKEMNLSNLNEKQISVIVNLNIFESKYAKSIKSFKTDQIIKVDYYGVIKKFITFFGENNSMIDFDQISTSEKLNLNIIQIVYIIQYRISQINISNEVLNEIVQNIDLDDNQNDKDFKKLEELRKDINSISKHKYQKQNYTHFKIIYKYLDQDFDTILLKRLFQFYVTLSDKIFKQAIQENKDQQNQFRNYYQSLYHTIFEINDFQLNHFKDELDKEYYSQVGWAANKQEQQINQHKQIVKESVELFLKTQIVDMNNIDITDHTNLSQRLWTSLIPDKILNLLEIIIGIEVKQNIQVILLKLEQSLLIIMDHQHKNVCVNMNNESLNNQISDEDTDYTQVCCIQINDLIQLNESIQELVSNIVAEYSNEDAQMDGKTLDALLRLNDQFDKSSLQTIHSTAEQMVEMAFIGELSTALNHKVMDNASSNEAALVFIGTLNDQTSGWFACIDHSHVRSKLLHIAVITFIHWYMKKVILEFYYAYRHHNLDKYTQIHNIKHHLHYDLDQMINCMDKKVSYKSLDYVNPQPIKRQKTREDINEVLDLDVIMKDLQILHHWLEKFTFKHNSTLHTIFVLQSIIHELQQAKYNQTSNNIHNINTNIKDKLKQTQSLKIEILEIFVESIIVMKLIAKPEKLDIRDHSQNLYKNHQ